MGSSATIIREDHPDANYNDSLGKKTTGGRLMSAAHLQHRPSKQSLKKTFYGSQRPVSTRSLKKMSKQQGATHSASSFLRYPKFSLKTEPKT